MGFPRNRSRARIPILRSLSASVIPKSDLPDDAAAREQPSPMSSLANSLTTLAHLGRQRRARHKSKADDKKLSVDASSRTVATQTAAGSPAPEPEPAPGPTPKLPGGNHWEPRAPPNDSAGAPAVGAALATPRRPSSTGAISAISAISANSRISPTSPTSSPPQTATSTEPPSAPPTPAAILDPPFPAACAGPPAPSPAGPVAVGKLTTSPTTCTAIPPPPVVLVQRPSFPTPPLPPPPCPRNEPESNRAMYRKIWVKRPGASPTRVEVDEDDLVDSVRDVILRKYANSLGRNIDSPDIVLKIVSREQNNKNVVNERPLGPEEPIGQTLDAYYPGGQTVEEALIIDVPSRRTPRPSPRLSNAHVSYFVPDHYRPDDGARDYFPPMGMNVSSPHLSQLTHPHHNQMTHAMSIVNTGQLPALPSPGAGSTRTSGYRQRPRNPRQHTSSPTILHTVQSNGQVLDKQAQMNGAPPAPPLPTPPPQGPNDHKPSITPPNRVGSPLSGQKARKKRNLNSARSVNGDQQPTPKPAAASLLDGTVPPINVLLVEDNVINLKLLEAFMKRLKVRWKSAMNGKEAVAMWRTGGFHLVLMDIQLPVMNGLQATKEIRRLEAVNGIGVFSGSPMEVSAAKHRQHVEEADRLPDRSLFKSPVIIVALTASSLQSDRHEALAAGCNDFLTKPVNFVWMERKVTEWGCMQALIDFDGWRKWKEYASEKAKEDPAKKAAEEKEEKAKARAALKAMFTRPPPTLKDRDKLANGSAEPTSKPQVNGAPKKSPGVGGRGHKGSRSSTSGLGLESMKEEDEKGS